ncbi:MAG: hypothetical protein Kow0089_10020 [Desulfobulbaceae bacterium]
MKDTGWLAAWRGILGPGGCGYERGKDQSKDHCCGAETRSTMNVHGLLPVDEMTRVPGNGTGIE